MKQSTQNLIDRLRQVTADNLHHVFAEYDGCLDDKPLFSGQHGQCLNFLRSEWNRYNRGKQSLALVSAKSGRCVSFVL